MISPLPSAPSTPLDGLRAQLASWGEDNASLASHLEGQLHKLKKQALRELGTRLGDLGAPKPFRRTILGLIPKFDWPEWCPFLLAALRQEPDLGLFDEGCGMLGVLGTRAAFQALQTLKGLRADPDRQTILQRELGLFQPQQPKEAYLSRLSEGEGNPKLAVQGARILSVSAEEEDLPAIAEAFLQGDGLTQRLAVRVLMSMPGETPLAFLLDQFMAGRAAFLENRQVMDVLQRIQTMPRPSAKMELLRHLSERFQERVPETALCIERAQHHEGDAVGGDLEPLSAAVRGDFDAFLLEAVTLQLEGKIARYSAYLSEQSDQAEAKDARLMERCDLLAEALGCKVDAGEVPLERVLPCFAEAFRARLGGEIFCSAYLLRLPVGETSLLDELLQDPDMARRQRYLSILGSREEDALAPFFLKAVHDSIVDVGQQAIHHLGKLPSSFPMLMERFQSGQQEQLRFAIRIFGENRTPQAAEPLLAFIQKDVRDDLLVEAVDALAGICYPAGTPALLELLHDGKPLNLQLSLVNALGQLGSPEASLGLLAKAPQLKQPQVLILCLEGAVTGFPGFEAPFPPECVPELLKLVDRCCDEREGEGNRLRAMLAMQDLYVFDRPVYEKLREQFSDFLTGMRAQETWDRDNIAKVAAVVKELAHRSASLGQMAEKEDAIRAIAHRLPLRGPQRGESLMALREKLLDPELILRQDMAMEMGGILLWELTAPGAEWRDVAYLCEIAGIIRRPELVDAIREIHLKATGLGLKSAARQALIRMGLTEQEINKRPPIRSILILDGSGFFRKRLAAALAAVGRWQVREAGTREEAASLLAEQGTDLLVTELQDASGDLAAWVDEQWKQNRFKYFLLSTSQRDLGDLGGSQALVGTLFKPYTTEQLIRALES